MNGLIDAESQEIHEIEIKVHFVDGDTFSQHLPFEYTEAVQDFLDWFRKPGRQKVFTFFTPATRDIHALHHSKIMAVDVSGYIEPDGRESRWYERLIDRFRLWRMTR
ncbi:hypothetical protein [Paenibacillus sp. BJ-4]|uniref:hypothetical protein n=1 Tax=Paenibacillus sp. BJ-4 TaxID=2878097 RepID=UPI001CEFC1F5|nr:hypothetical protein [Paenibacillus sp. BJ-4]